MIIADKLYNLIQVNDSSIERLINTKPFQRLKEINQYGGVNFVYPNKYQVSRFDHCLGAYHVLKTIGADRQTQIVGLLHDIGHTALSHMYDMALNTHTEDNHEQIMHKLEGWNEIQDILNEINVKDINPDNYFLIKKSLPDIGADRFDYALRDYIFATNEATHLPNKLLKDLSIDNDGMFFNSLGLAKEFAQIANKAMWYVIYEPSVAVVYQSLVEMIRIGLNDGWLSDDDFMKNDKHVIDLMLKHYSTIPEKYTRIFKDKFEVSESTSNDFDFKFVKLKSRYFDPRVKYGDGYKRVSELDSDFKEKLEDYVRLFEKAKTGVYYKIKFE